MPRGRHAKPSKVNQKISVAVVAGATGLGTMLSMVPASFADTLPTNNESQNTSSKAVSSALKLSKLNQIQPSLNSMTTGYQTQAKQQAVAENLSALTQELEGILHDTPYMSRLSTVKSALESVENTLKTPNLPTSDLKGSTKTQGKLQDLVKQLQTIINDASAQYDTELKNAANDYQHNLSNYVWAALIDFASPHSGGYPAWPSASSVNNFTQNVYDAANTANNPDLATANSAFSTNAAAAANAAGSTSDSSTILGKAKALQQNAEKQLNNINTEIENYSGNMPQMGSSSGLIDIESKWEQDYANYKYLQSVQPYAQTIANEAQTALDKAEDAANKIAAAKQLADQNTGDSASDAAAAAQAKADIQSALQDVAAANSAGEAIKAAMSSAAAQHASATSSTSPSVTISGSTVDLPEAANKAPLYSSSVMDEINSDFGNYVNQANNMLSGSDSGTGTGGLLGDATAWQKAIVTQGVFNDAQKAYNAMKGVQQDWKDVVIKSAPNMLGGYNKVEPVNPGAAINSLHKLQSDLILLYNNLQSAITGMHNGNKTIQGMGLPAPYSQQIVYGTETTLPMLAPLAGDLDYTSPFRIPGGDPAPWLLSFNPIQKAIVAQNEYNFVHSIVVGLQPHVQVLLTLPQGDSQFSSLTVVGNLRPDIRSLIGQGSEPGSAQKILALPFQTMPAVSIPSGTANSGEPSHMTQMPSQSEVHVQQAKPSDSHLASTGSSIEAASISAGVLLAAGSGEPSHMTQMPSQSEVHVQQAKPSDSHLASTGSSIEAASISAGVLLAAGIAAELLKKKKTDRNK